MLGIATRRARSRWRKRAGFEVDLTYRRVSPLSLPLTNNRDGRNEKNARRVVHFPPRIRTRVSRSIANGDKFIHDSKKKKEVVVALVINRIERLFYFFLFFISLFFFLDLDRTTFFTHELLVTR